MTPSLTILCPGQGAQTIGMAKDFHDASPVAQETFDTANRILGLDLASICFNGPEDRLNQTDISQPAIYTASVASFRAAVNTGKITPQCVAVHAGLSLGEYTALHLGGAFTFEQGLQLVAARGRYMQQAAVASPSGMVALIGADAATAQKLCDDAAQGQVLLPANYNAPGQIVISGDQAACKRALTAAETAGIKAVELKVAGAFHSPLMQPAADQMRRELDQVEFHPLQKTVYSNVTAQPHGDSASIKERLVEQIVKPVLWEQTMQTLIAAGETSFIELSPGRTLAGLAKRINRRLPVESVAL